MVNVIFQAGQILLYGDDSDARLVFVEGKLAAVVSRLGSESYADDLRGRWHLEAGFGPCHSHETSLFADLDEVREWASRAHAKVTGSGEVGEGEAFHRNAA